MQRGPCCAANKSSETESAKPSAQRRTCGSQIFDIGLFHFNWLKKDHSLLFREPHALLGACGLYFLHQACDLVFCKPSLRGVLLNEREQ